MKHLIFLLFALPFANTIIAQTTYESPHVKDGKTMQVTIPAGYFNIMDTGSGNVVFATDENLDLDASDDLDSIELGMLTVMHMPSDGKTLEMLREDLTKDAADKDKIVVLEAPVVRDINGLECLFAGYDGDLIDEGVDRIYFSAIEFGDYIFMINYFSSEKLEEPLEYEKFKEVIASCKEIATTKEDELAAYYSFEEEMDHVATTDEDFEIGYKNDFFETDLTYYDVMPDFIDNWDEPIDDNSHLLSEFKYKEDNGRIKIFSGGYSSVGSSEEDMANAIKLVMSLPNDLTVTFDSQFSNEDHLFKLYSVSGGGTMTSFYTTLIYDEMVFFVVDGGPNPVDDFKPAVRDFMLTMWVDDFSKIDNEEE